MASALSALLTPQQPPVQPQPRVLGAQTQVNTPNVAPRDLQADIARLNKLQLIAPALGFKEQEVNDFVKKYQTDIVAKQGVPIDQIQTDPDLLRVQATQAVMPGFTPPVSKETKDLTKEQAKETKNQDAAQAFVDYLKANPTALTLNDVPAENRADVAALLKEQNINLESLAKQDEGKNVANMVKNLRDDFKTNKLAQGRGFGAVGNILGKVGLNDNISTYNNSRDAAILGLRDLVTAKGGRAILSEPIIKRLDGLLPRVTDNPGEAKKNWVELQRLIKDKYDIDIGAYDETDQQSSDTGPMKVGRFTVEQL